MATTVNEQGLDERLALLEKARVRCWFDSPLRLESFKEIPIDNPNGKFVISSYDATSSE